MNDLVIIEPKNAMTVFGTEGGTVSIIEEIEKKCRSLVPDISTEKGRAEIKSLAYDVARTKTAIDEMGKGLTEDMKKTTKLVDGERKRVRDRLDALKDEVRRPLTEWEDAEKERVKAHENALIAIEGRARLVESGDLTSLQIQDQIDAAGAEHAGRDWQEFTARSNRIVEDVISRLQNKRDAAKKREDEQAELERLREAEAERARIADEEKRIADEKAAEEKRQKDIADAAEKARKEAEEKAELEKAQAAADAKAEQDRIEKEKQEALDAAKKAEDDRIAAQKKADEDAKAAEERRIKEAADAEQRLKDEADRAERQRIEDAEKAEADAKRREDEATERERKRLDDLAKTESLEAAKRAEDKAHRARINGEVLAAMIKVMINGADETLSNDAKAIITAIAKGEIPHVSIKY